MVDNLSASKQWQKVSTGFLAEVMGEGTVGEQDFHACIGENRKGLTADLKNRLLPWSKVPGINAGLSRRHKVPGTTHLY